MKMDEFQQAFNFIQCFPIAAEYLQNANLSRHEGTRVYMSSDNEWNA